MPEITQLLDFATAVVTLITAIVVGFTKAREQRPRRKKKSRRR